jgi:hypothetical protein
LVDAHGPGHRLGGEPVVAGQQDRRQAEPAQFGHGFGAVLLDGVGDGEDAARLAVPGDDDCRTPLGLRRGLGLGQFAGQLDGPLVQELLAPDEYGVAVDDALDAEAGDVLEVLRYGQAPGPVGCARCDGLRDRVLRGVLQCACQAQQFALVHVRCREHVLELHPAGGHCAGLVQDDGVDTAGGLQDLGPLMRMPSWAPRPVPAIGAVGVAGPSAQGQAVIRTATAAVKAAVTSPVTPSQTPSVAAAISRTAGKRKPAQCSESPDEW